MAEIVEFTDPDNDTVDEIAIAKYFNKNFILKCEQAVSLSKSYVNKLDGTRSLKLASSLSDNSIEVYEITNRSLNRVCKLRGHSKTVTDLVFSPDNESLLYSSSHEGCIKLWDTRKSGSCVMEYKDADSSNCKPLESFDISCNGKILCAGSQLVKEDAFIVFWDQRKPEPLGGYWNSHTDDITQVRFHKEKIEIVATGSSDGLVNIFNIIERTEDDALTYSLNVENSVEKLNWLDENRLACITQSNDFQVWDASSGDMVKNYTRDRITQAIKRSRDDECYLVDTFVMDDTPVLLAGSYGGNGRCLRSVYLTDKKLVPCTDFKDNKQIVRCCWYQDEKGILVTGGESGFISVWSPSDSQTSESENTSNKLSTSLNKLKVHRNKPYRR